MSLAILANEDLELHQMDVKMAFLHGELTEDIFMTQPEGYVDQKYPDYFWKLKKALYGLNQAPRRWFEKINDYLGKDLWFESCLYDSRFYVRRMNGCVLTITIYVDDILIAGNSLKAISEIKEEQAKVFEMKDCGEAKVCLGFEIVRNRKLKLLKLKQEAYAEKVLSRSDMTKSKAVNTPMEAQLDKAITDEELIDENLYAQAIRSLMYLMICSRPDIGLVEGRLTQYINKPAKSLWTCVKRVLRYICGTASAGLVSSAQTDNSSVPVGYSDLDWAGCKIDRNSTPGYVFCVSGGAIS